VVAVPPCSQLADLSATRLPTPAPITLPPRCRILHVLHVDHRPSSPAIRLACHWLLDLNHRPRLAPQKHLISLSPRSRPLNEEWHPTFTTMDTLTSAPSASPLVRLTRSWPPTCNPCKSAPSPSPFPWATLQRAIFETLVAPQLPPLCLGVVSATVMMVVASPAAIGIPWGSCPPCLVSNSYQMNWTLRSRAMIEVRRP
jgi:hypothetical protein